MLENHLREKNLSGAEVGREETRRLEKEKREKLNRGTERCK